MKLAYYIARGRGAADAVMAEVVEALSLAGLALAGTAPVGPMPAERQSCGMVLRLLPDGPQIAISQNLGPGARGCRLDGEALEGAAVATRGALAGARVLVVNKFGKLEAAGRGFVPVIEEALEAGKVVLVGVSDLNEAAFGHFHGGVGLQLPPSAPAIVQWVMDADRAEGLSAREQDLHPG